MAMVISRFHVFLVRLDPRWSGNGQDAAMRDHISQRMQPHFGHSHHCANDNSDTRLADPRAIRFAGKTGEIILDQIRAVDKKRLIRRLGTIETETEDLIVEGLAEMFAR